MHALEKVRGRRVDDQNVALLADAGAPGVQAAPELGKLRVFAKGFGVGGVGGAVAFALDFLGFAVGVGQDDFALDRDRKSVV